jgi:hypothetical protein
MDDHDLLLLIKKEMPHLYDVEMQVRRVVRDSGFGDVSMVLHVTNGIVDRGEVLGSTKRIYYRRVGNQLVRIDNGVE